MSPSTSSPNLAASRWPGDEVVEDDDAVAGAVQRLGGVAADVSGAAGDEHARASQRPMEKYVKPSARMCSGE